jgi:hypothetical protein
MTPEERLERIENGWLEIQQTLKAVMQSQINTNEKIGSLIESIGQYVDAANARTSRLEDNLDALIRAITAEHSNGKGQH